MNLNITIDNYFTTPSIHEKSRAFLAKNPGRKIVKLHLTKYQKEQLFHAMGIKIRPHRSKIQSLKEFFQEKFKWHKRQLRVLKGPLRINQPKVSGKSVGAPQFKIDNPIRRLKTVAVSIKDKQIDNKKLLESGNNTSVHPHSQKIPEVAQPIGLSSDLIHPDADDQLSSVPSHPCLMSANSTDSTQESIGYPQMSETTKPALLQPKENSQLDSPETSHYIPIKTVAVSIKDKQIDNKKLLESGDNTSVHPHSQKIPEVAQPIGLSSDLIHPDADDQLSSVPSHPCLMSANSTDSTQESIGYPQMSETTKPALLQPMENAQLDSPETSHYVPNEVSLPENLQSEPTLQEDPAIKFSAKTAKGLAITTAAVAAPLAIGGAASSALYLVAMAHPIIAAVTAIGVVSIGMYMLVRGVVSWVAGNKRAG